MKQSQHRKWDIIVRSGGVILAMITVLFSVSRYSLEEARTKESLTRKERNWEYQRDLFARTSELIGSIVLKSSDRKSFEEEEDSFLRLYFGELNLVNDSIISKPIENFRFSLRDYVSSDQKSIDEIRHNGHLAIISLRKSINKSWDEFETD